MIYIAFDKLSLFAIFGKKFNSVLEIKGDARHLLSYLVTLLAPE